MMIKYTMRRSAPILVSVILVTVIFSCTMNKFDPDYNPHQHASCEGCHTDYAYLKEIYTPEPDSVKPSGGCGGDIDYYEPYDRVYLDPEEGYIDFKASTHYGMGCTSCHNGNNSTDDKNLAHSGDFIKHPSLVYDEKCSSVSCHGTITDGFKTNIHHGVGQKRKVCIRDGESGPDDFEKLDAALQRGYNKKCATCHGTCGTCHVNRPIAGGGGLMAGHNFQAPDWKKNCITCHTSRGGHAYLGVAVGTKPDIHYVYPDESDTVHYDESFEGKTHMRKTCTSCHDTDELHGDGVKVDQRYAYSKLPTCEECHPTASDGITELAEANTYHKLHYEDFNCHVCHSQDYNSCGSCHVDGEGARLEHHLDFKIAKNPIPDIKQDYEYALVRRTLGAPDNFVLFTGRDYKDFDAFPMFNYTTPHNIQKWTSRTNKNYLEEGKCGKNCHFMIQGNDTINKDLYLLKEHLVHDWEISSTEWMTMDDVLFSK